jgi:hypothetical protein
MTAAAAAFGDAVREIGSSPAPQAPQSPIWRFRRTSRVASIRGSIRRERTGDLHLRPGALAEMDLLVRNQGPSEWISSPEPSGGHVGVAADVLSRAGDLVVRTSPVALARDLAPGEEAAVRLSFRAPAEPGDYRLQPTLVHFGRGGSLAAGSAIPLVVAAGSLDNR